MTRICQSHQHTATLYHSQGSRDLGRERGSQGRAVEEAAGPVWPGSSCGQRAAVHAQAWAATPQSHRARSCA
eukprot:scaffold51746_cov63-Phaeocystis_antarctica.AAC.4